MRASDQKKLDQQITANNLLSDRLRDTRRMAQLDRNMALKAMAGARARISELEEQLGASVERVSFLESQIPVDGGDSAS